MSEIKTTNLLECVKMKCVFIIFLASFKIVNAYSIIQSSDTPTFKIYWNMPTFQCASKRIPFTHIYNDFGILQNRDDRFLGDKMSILYHPGQFPWLTSNGVLEHGGIPQEGDLSAHLEKFRSDLEKSIPDETFDGLGVIDMERWRPIYNQNYSPSQKYIQTESYNLEKKIHDWKESWLQAEAKRNFELSAREYMLQTLATAKEMRPLAQWGYYGFPYCFNMEGSSNQEACSSNTQKLNDEAYWLWAESDALYPSLYSKKELSASELASLIKGRVAESKRVAAKNTPIYPYFSLTYRNGGFFSENDLNTALDALYKSNASGVIIWASSNDVKTPKQCKEFLKYVNEVFGPAVIKYTKPKLEIATRSRDNNLIPVPTQTPSLVDLILRNIANATNTQNTNVYSQDDITIVVIRKTSSHNSHASAPSVNTINNCSDSTPININFNEIHIHNSGDTDVNANKYLDNVNSNGIIISEKEVVNNTDKQKQVASEANSTALDQKTQIDGIDYTVISNKDKNGMNIEDATEGIYTDKLFAEDHATERDHTNRNFIESDATEGDHTDRNFTEDDATEGDHTDINFTEDYATEGDHTDRNFTEDDATEGDHTDINFTEDYATEGDHTDRNFIEDVATEGDHTDRNFTEDDATEGDHTDINFTEDYATEGDHKDRNFIEDVATEGDHTDRNFTEDDATEGDHTDRNFTEDYATEGDHTDRNFTEDYATEGDHTDGNFTEDYDATEGDHTDRNFTEDYATEGDHTDRNFTEDVATEGDHTDRNFTEDVATEGDHADRNITKVNGTERNYTTNKLK